MKINEEVERLITCFRMLELEKLNPQLINFFENNIDYFLKNDDININFKDKNNVELRLHNNENSSSFEINFIPDAIKPSNVKLTLVHFSLNYNQSFYIQFDEDDIIEIKYVKTHLKNLYLTSVEEYEQPTIYSKYICKSIYSNLNKIYEKQQKCLLMANELGASNVEEKENYYLDAETTLTKINIINSINKEEFDVGSCQYKYFKDGECQVLIEEDFEAKKDAFLQINPKLKKIKK